MVQYRLVVSSPATATSAAKSWEFTPTSEARAIEVRVEHKKDKHRISNLMARIYDPKRAIFNALPDPAYSNVPVKLYLSKPGDPSSVTYLVFDGKVTKLASAFPGPTTLQLDAHDKSVDMRRVKRGRLFRGKTAVQIAQTLAAEYGFDTEIALGTVTLGQTAIDWRPTVSDWDHIGNALAADGLELFYDAKRSKMVIRQQATTTYAATIRPDSGVVQKLSCEISHIRGPGEGGDRRGSLDVEQTGQPRAVTATATAAATAKEGADETTHRRPVKGPSTATTGSHSEDVHGSPWSNRVDLTRRRKDQLTLTAIPLPDLGLHHWLNFAGWGAKIDGTWAIESIHYTLVGDSGRTMSVTCNRSLSKGGAKQAGLEAEATRVSA